MEDETLYTIHEAAERLNVSKDTVRRRIKKGEIKAEKRQGPYGLAYYIPESELSPSTVLQVVPIQRNITKQELKQVFDDSLSPQETQLQQLREEVKELRQELKQVLEQNRELKQVLEQDQREEMPWWKRIFGK